jgi:hypothetical protein
MIGSDSSSQNRIPLPLDGRLVLVLSNHAGTRAALVRLVATLGAQGVLQAAEGRTGLEVIASESTCPPRPTDRSDGVEPPHQTGEDPRGRAALRTQRSTSDEAAA